MFWMVLRVTKTFSEGSWTPNNWRNRPSGPGPRLQNRTSGRQKRQNQAAKLGFTSETLNKPKV